MAKKAESTLVNMLVSLTLIALVAAFLLAAINGITEEPIKNAQEAKKQAAISAVLPQFDKVEDRTVDGVECHIGLNEQGEMVGVAIEDVSDNGFGGPLKVMVGFKADGTISGYKVLETKETPGLGAKADQWFQEGSKGNIIGKSKADTKLEVKKDGGDVDAITGSTITSRAFLSIVRSAADTFEKING